MRLAASVQISLGLAYLVAVAAKHNIKIVDLSVFNEALSAGIRLFKFCRDAKRISKEKDKNFSLTDLKEQGIIYCV